MSGSVDGSGSVSGVVGLSGNVSGSVSKDSSECRSVGLRSRVSGSSSNSGSGSDIRSLARQREW